VIIQQNATINIYSTYCGMIFGEYTTCVE